MAVLLGTKKEIARDERCPIEWICNHIQEIVAIETLSLIRCDASDAFHSQSQKYLFSKDVD